MTPDDLELLERLRDGTLAAATRDGLARRLIQDPALRAEMARDLRLGNALRAVALARDPQVAQRTLALIDAEQPVSSQRAVARVMASIAPWWRQPRTWIAAASLAAVITISFWLTAQPAIAWSDGAALFPGATVPADVHELRFADGSTVIIAPSSRVRLGDDAQRKHLYLDTGSIDAHVTTQRDGASFSVSTPYGDADVRGTRFQVAVADDSSIVSVSEGRVDVRHGDDAVSVAAGERVVAADQHVLPMVAWKDRRPLGRLVVAGPLGPPERRFTNDPNPNGWLFEPTLDAHSATLAQHLEATLAQTVTTLRSVGAQGVLLYGIEGGAHHYRTGFVGDPRRVPELAPEFDALADSLFARLRAAGLATGVTVSPWRLERLGATWQQTLDPATCAAELDGKIAYARKRWGCTLFYVNRTAPNATASDRIPDSALRLVAAHHPDVLLIIEDASAAQSAVGAAQALGGNRVPAGRAVIRLPWFQAKPTPDSLTAARAAKDILMFDPQVQEQADAIRGDQQLPVP